MSFAVTSSVALNPWVQILGALEKKVNRQSFDTWLKPTRFSHVTRADALRAHSHARVSAHVGDRYGDLIQEAIEDLHLEFDDVSFITPEEDPDTATRSRGRRFRAFSLHADAAARERMAGVLPQADRNSHASTGRPPRS